MKFYLKVLFVLCILSISCEKEKDNDCENVDPVCKEFPPTDELCEAYFTRWFYNSETNDCEQIGYSGCSFYGFETKEECEDCGCE